MYTNYRFFITVFLLGASRLFSQDISHPGISGELMASRENTPSAYLISKSHKKSPVNSYHNFPAGFDQYGGQYGIGFGFGDGLMANFRYSLSPKTALEGGIGYASTMVPIEEGSFEEENPFNTEGGFQFEAAAHLMAARKENRKGKIKANGIMLRAGHLFGDFATTFLSGGYGVEVFNPNKKKNNRSYLFEVGLKASFPQWETNTFGYGDPPPVFPYLRFRWFWYQ